MAPTPDPYSPARLADRARIADLSARYCRAIDRRDFDDLRALYHPDAVDHHGTYDGDLDGFLDYLRTRHRDIPFSMHSVSNSLVEFTGPDSALVETSVTCWQTYPPTAGESLAPLAGRAGGAVDGPTQLLVVGRYVDQITRRDGAWRFAVRDFVYDSGLLLAGEPTSVRDDWNLGRRDPDDAIYRALAAAGRPA